MIVDGREIADQIYGRLRADLENRAAMPRIAAIVVAPTFETRKFLAIKKKKAEALRISVEVIELDPRIDTASLIDAMKRELMPNTGIVLQLPFPQHIDVEHLLSMLPEKYDVDAIGAEAQKDFKSGKGVLPPVVGAISEIAARHNFSFSGKRSVVVGKGRLVGGPVAAWLKMQHAEVEVCDITSRNLGEAVKWAEALVLGAGVPGLITSDMVSDGVAIFDAGTSEAAGKIAGDADARCAEKASLFTPVPGGIGPVTVAKLLENLIAITASTARA